MKQYLLLIPAFLLAVQLFGQSFADVKKSVEQGIAKAQFMLGLMFYGGEGTLTDKKQAAYWIKKSNKSRYG